jgi:hypothetical protein
MGNAPLQHGTAIDGRSFLGRLKGARGNQRSWVFWHYDPRPGWDKKQYTLVRFARDQRFKLYDDGRFYHIPSDPLERQPLANATGAARQARQNLQAVLDRMRAYTGAHN